MDIEDIAEIIFTGLIYLLGFIAIVTIQLSIFWIALQIVKDVFNL